MNDQRLFDLVRYQRAELFMAKLITEEEYATLATTHGSVQRLESYDVLRAELARAQAELTNVHDALHAECDGTANLPAEIRALRAELARVKAELEAFRKATGFDDGEAVGLYLSRLTMAESDATHGRVLHGFIDRAVKAEKERDEAVAESKKWVNRANTLANRGKEAVVALAARNSWATGLCSRDRTPDPLCGICNPAIAAARAVMAEEAARQAEAHGQYGLAVVLRNLAPLPTTLCVVEVSDWEKVKAAWGAMEEFMANE